MMPPPTASLLTSALAIVHFVLAASVTLHVLLTKRNPASSVAWIGLAWCAGLTAGSLAAAGFAFARRAG